MSVPDPEIPEKKIDGLPAGPATRGLPGAISFSAEETDPRKTTVSDSALSHVRNLRDDEKLIAGPDPVEPANPPAAQAESPKAGIGPSSEESSSEMDSGEVCDPSSGRVESKGSPDEVPAEEVSEAAPAPDEQPVEAFAGASADIPAGAGNELDVSIPPASVDMPSIVIAGGATMTALESGLTMGAPVPEIHAESGNPPSDPPGGETSLPETHEDDANVQPRGESSEAGRQVNDGDSAPAPQFEETQPAAGSEGGALPEPQTAGDPEESYGGEEQAEPVIRDGNPSVQDEAGAGTSGEIPEASVAESLNGEEIVIKEGVVDDLAHIIEAIIFASDEPLPVSTIKSVLDSAHTFGRINPDMITSRIAALNAKYELERSGFCIIEIANGFQYATRKDMAQWVSYLFKERSKRRLSNSALETLAIIAYKQPVTKPEIESIRGVNVDYVLHNLLEKELVTVVGRAETVGRPLLYGTTQKFMKVFSLKSLDDLPKLREIEEIIKEIKSKGAEESIQLEITALGDSFGAESQQPDANQEATPENGAE